MDFGLSGVQQGEEISKKQDWKNISEHQRRGADARRRRRAAGNVAGLGAAVGAGALLAANSKGINAFQQASNVARSAKYAGIATARQPKHAQLHGTLFGRVAQKNPYGAVALGGYGTAAGGIGVAGVHQANSNRHNRAIARQRRQRAVKKAWAPNVKLGDPAKMTVKSKVVRTKKGKLSPMVPPSKQITKAYDPERNRSNRLKRYEQATMFGAGATGAAAGQQAFRAAGAAKTYRGAKPTAYKGKLVALKSGAKHGGKAAGLGLAATGLAVGSQRIGSYRKGRGRSYSSLRTIGY